MEATTDRKCEKSSANLTQSVLWALGLGNGSFQKSQVWESLPCLMSLITDSQQSKTHHKASILTHQRVTQRA
jgi:hypothetical protein